MKKIFYSIATLSIILLTGCDNNTDTFNNNEDAPYDVSAESLLTNAEKELMDQMTTSSVNFSPFRYFTQYWAQTTYNDESRFSLNRRNVPQNHWNTLYRNVLGNLASAKGVIASEVRPNDISEADWTVKQQNKVAIIEILQVYTFQVLVDSFGDIPYTEALNPEIKLPSYEDDAVIYPKLIIRLDAALAQLNADGSSFDTGDYLYEGDIMQWKLFANSLKVKIGLNLADVDATLAQSTVESGFTGGVILANADNTTFNYPGSAPNYNPVYADLVASQRNDYTATTTFVNALESVNDPRIGIYYQANDGEYIGGVPGLSNVPYTAFSNIGDVFRSPNFPGQLFEATELNFYLAEAAARGYAVGNSAEYYYNQAIMLSFESWGLSALSADYLAQPAVAYATAAGDYKQKIGVQAWYAFFNRPFESWNSWRRLDFPSLVAPANAVSAADGEIPKRLTYPTNERTVNTTNYKAAVEAIGGADRLKVHVFWDKF